MSDPTPDPVAQAVWRFREELARFDAHDPAVAQAARTVLAHLAAQRAALEMAETGRKFAIARAESAEREHNVAEGRHLRAFRRAATAEANLATLSAATCACLGVLQDPKPSHPTPWTYEKHGRFYLVADAHADLVAECSEEAVAHVIVDVVNGGCSA